MDVRKRLRINRSLNVLFDKRIVHSVLIMFSTYNDD